MAIRYRLFAGLRRRAAARKAQEPLRSLLLNPPPAWHDWRRGRYLVLDIESTGLDTARDQIVSIGWVIIEGRALHLRHARHELVAGAAGVGQSATIHQITDQTRAGGRPLRAVLDELLPLLAEHLLVLHHAPLDRGLLSAACRRLYGAPLLLPCIDTLYAERLRLGRQGRHPAQGDLRLGACRVRYGLPDYPAHDALTDALATAELFLAQATHHSGGLRVPTRRLGGFRSA